MEQTIKLTEKELCKLIKESVTILLNEDSSEPEYIPVYDVLRHISESEIEKLLLEHVYNKNGEDVGQLGYLYIKNVPSENEPSIF